MNANNQPAPQDDGAYFRPPATMGGNPYEVGATAAAAQSKALAEARYIVAMRRPRNMDQVRQDLLRECRRPAFARNKSAYYHKPIGQGVEGLGIRFVEVALRCLGNMDIGASMTYEDDRKEVYRVSVVDLESNVPYFIDVPVSKTVERSRANDDGSYISARRNSGGRVVYTVGATDDDMLNKRNALISKAVRTLGLRHVPGDLQDEAESIIKAIRLDEAARDPDAERHQLADAFAGIGVSAQQLSAYLGHDLGTCTPAELVQLRGIYGAIRDGESSWTSVMESVAAAKKPEAGTAPAAPPAATATGRLKERIKKGAAKAPDAAQEGASEPEGGQGMAETSEQLRAAVMAAKDSEAAYLVVDRARHLSREDYDGLIALVESRFEQGGAS